MTPPPDLEVLARLEATIAARKAALAAGEDPSASHTARLLAKGPLKCAEKMGEEAIEAVIAAAAQDRHAVIAESADLLYHLLVALAARDVRLAEVCAALAAREGVSGVEEKARRTP